MGYYHHCYKRKACNYGTHTSDVVVMLAVALMLLGIQWFFSRSGSSVVVVEEKKINWSALVTPLLVLLILLLVSPIGSSTRRKPYVKPMCCRCKHACYCYWYIMVEIGQKINTGVNYGRVT